MNILTHLQQHNLVENLHEIIIKVDKRRREKLARKAVKERRRTGEGFLSDSSIGLPSTWIQTPHISKTTDSFPKIMSWNPIPEPSVSNPFTSLDQQQTQTPSHPGVQSLLEEAGLKEALRPIDGSQYLSSFKPPEQPHISTEEFIENLKKTCTCRSANSTDACIDKTPLSKVTKFITQVQKMSHLAKQKWVKHSIMLHGNHYYLPGFGKVCPALFRTFWGTSVLEIRKLRTDASLLDECDQEMEVHHDSFGFFGDSQMDGMSSFDGTSCQFREGYTTTQRSQFDGGSHHSPFRGYDVYAQPSSQFDHLSFHTSSQFDERVTNISTPSQFDERFIPNTINSYPSSTPIHNPYPYATMWPTMDTQPPFMSSSSNMTHGLGGAFGMIMANEDGGVRDLAFDTPLPQHSSGGAVGESAVTSHASQAFPSAVNDGKDLSAPNDLTETVDTVDIVADVGSKRASNATSEESSDASSVDSGSGESGSESETGNGLDGNVNGSSDDACAENGRAVPRSVIKIRPGLKERRIRRRKVYKAFLSKRFVRESIDTAPENIDTTPENIDTAPENIDTAPQNTDTPTQNIPLSIVVGSRSKTYATRGNVSRAKVMDVSEVHQKTDDTPQQTPGHNTSKNTTASTEKDPTSVHGSRSQSNATRVSVSGSKVGEGLKKGEVTQRTPARNTTKKPTASTDKVPCSCVRGSGPKVNAARGKRSGSKVKAAIQSRRNDKDKRKRNLKSLDVGGDSGDTSVRSPAVISIKRRRLSGKEDGQAQNQSGAVVDPNIPTESETITSTETERAILRDRNRNMYEFLPLSSNGLSVANRTNGSATKPSATLLREKSPLGDKSTRRKKRIGDLNFGKTALDLYLQSDDVIMPGYPTDVTEDIPPETLPKKKLKTESVKELTPQKLQQKKKPVSKTKQVVKKAYVTAAKNGYDTASVIPKPKKVKQRNVQKPTTNTTGDGQIGVVRAKRDAQIQDLSQLGDKTSRRRSRTGDLGFVENALDLYLESVDAVIRVDPTDETEDIPPEIAPLKKKGKAGGMVGASFAKKVEQANTVVTKKKVVKNVGGTAKKDDAGIISEILKKKVKQRKNGVSKKTRVVKKSVTAIEDGKSSESGIVKHNNVKQRKKIAVITKISTNSEVIKATRTDEQHLTTIKVSGGNDFVPRRDVLSRKE